MRSSAKKIWNILFRKNFTKIHSIWLPYGFTKWNASSTTEYKYFGKEKQNPIISKTDFLALDSDSFYKSIKVL